jgi:hypothetical protein
MSLSSLQLDQTGNFDLLYNFFYVRDYRNVETYESYNLPFTPLHFIPNLNDGIEDFISNKRIVWDFGDGTTTEAVTASHVFETPGRYKVSCYLYDRNGTGYYDTYHAKVDIKDFTADRLTVTTDDNLTSATGQLSAPINVNRYNSARTALAGIPTIVAHASGADVDRDYFNTNISDQTYGHLLPYTAFMQQLTSNGIVETIEVDAIQTDDTNLYVKLSGNEIVYTTEQDPDAVFAGLTGNADVYFKSDFAGDYNLLFGYEEGGIFKYNNTTNYGLSCTVKNNTDVGSLTITSNGIDSEGSFGNTIFHLGEEKFANTKISFVVKMKDLQQFTQKNVPKLDTYGNPTVSVVLTDGTTDYPIEVGSNSIELSSIETAGGYFKGYFTSDNKTTLSNVYLSANSNFNSSVITGTSNTFNINPSDYYTIAKQSEDIDFEDAFKEIAIQPLFADAKVLMKDFVGSIFGNLSSAQDSVGKSTYEKIQNFFDNNSTLDYSNIDQLDGMLQMLDLPELTKYSLPPKLKRLVDLLSIGKSRLFGERNRNMSDYQSYGYRGNDVYGYNLGEEISPGGKIIDGDPIIAFEKFSGVYTTLNTSLPTNAINSPVITITDGYIYTSNTGTLLSSVSEELSDGVELTLEQLQFCPVLTESDLSLLTDSLSTSTQYYILSDYNSSWGWPLVEGGGRDITDIYTFYYQASSVGEISNSIINFSDSNNTLSYNITSYDDWSKDNGIMSNIFANSLYEGLNLFEE